MPNAACISVMRKFKPGIVRVSRPRGTAGLLSVPVAVKFATEFVNRGVVSHDHAAFAGGDGLGEIKAKNAGIRQRARIPAAVFGAQSLARVFENTDLVAFCDAGDALHVGGVAEHVHRDDEFRSSA